MFWNGYAWVDEHPPQVPQQHSGHRVRKWLATLPILLLLPALALPFMTAAAAGPSVVLQGTAAPGGLVRLIGEHFTPYQVIQVRWDRLPEPVRLIWVRSNGRFAANLRIPRTAKNGSHSVELTTMSRTMLPTVTRQIRSPKTSTVAPGRRLARLTVRIGKKGTTGQATSGGSVRVKPAAQPADSNRKVITLAPGGNVQSAVNTASADVVQLGCGTYSIGYLRLPVRSASNPLTIRAASRWCAVVRGTVAARAGSAYVTIDGLSFEGNQVADTGIVTIGGWQEASPNHITLRNLRFKGNHGTTQNQSHSIYISYDTPTAILIEDLTVEGSGRTMTGVHAYHNPNGRTVTIRRFSISDASVGLLLWADMTGLVIDDGTISNSTQGVDISNSPHGTISRVQTVNAPTNLIGTGMVQGTGANANDF